MNRRYSNDSGWRAIGKDFTIADGAPSVLLWSETRFLCLVDVNVKYRN
jgi:hypothetical protein